MKQALGLVEVTGLSNAVVVADTMLKAANVQMLDIENSKGLGFMTIKIIGDVGAVNAAIMAGKQLAIQGNSLVSTKVIPRPSDYIEKTFLKKDEVKVVESSNNKIDVKLEETKDEKKVELEQVEIKIEENTADIDSVKIETVAELTKEIKEVKNQEEKPKVENKKNTTKKKK